jgi:uncharacterized protein (DUF362 family)
VNPVDRAESDPDPTAVSRRRFIARSAGTAAAIGVAAAAGLELRRHTRPEPWDPRAFPPTGDANVAVLSASSYTIDLEGVVHDGLRAIGADVRGARVLLKPNMVEYDPGAVINTDPRLVAGAISALRRLGATEVVVAEGPGHRRDTSYVVQASGLTDATRDAGASFVDLNVARAAEVPLSTRYTELGTLWLPNAVTSADLVVSMPKVKTHHWAGVTLSLKNCFGCLPGRMYGWPKNILHWQGIDASILDVAAAVRPDLVIADGIVGMQGDGPISGTPVELRAVVVADDPVAADVVVARMMGFDPGKISYLMEAGRFLGQAVESRIRVAAEDPSTLETPFDPAPGFDDLRSA